MFFSPRRAETKRLYPRDDVYRRGVRCLSPSVAARQLPKRPAGTSEGAFGAVHELGRSAKSGVRCLSPSVAYGDSSLSALRVRQREPLVRCVIWGGAGSTAGLAGLSTALYAPGSFLPESLPAAVAAAGPDPLNPARMSSAAG